MKIIFILIILYPLWGNAQTTRGSRVVSDARPKYKALMIGINDYANPGFADLKTPVKDITRLGELLERRYRFEPISYLKDKEATEAGIREKLKDFVLEVGPDDSLLIYYAGHGIEGEAQTGYWIPHDGDVISTAGYISNSDIIGYLRSSNARHILVISDACFSGTLFEGATPQNRLNYNAQFQKRSRWAMTSGNNTPVSDEGPGGNSAFAHNLIRILSTSDQPYLTPNYITGEIGSRVYHHSNSRQLPRCGRMEGDRGGSFIFWNQEAFKPDGGSFKPPWEGYEDQAIVTLREMLRKRRVWVPRGEKSICEKLEALEMIVECDPDYSGPNNNGQEIVSFCGQIRDEAIHALRDYLGLSYYQIKTHQNRPELFQNRECGRPYEIVINN